MNSINERIYTSYLAIPDFILQNELFSSLTNDEIVLYAYLLKTCRMSVINDFKDKEGNVTVICTGETALKVLRCKSFDKVTKCFRSLEKAKLISRQRIGRNSTYYILVFVPVSEDEKTVFAKAELSFSLELNSRTRDHEKSGRKYNTENNEEEDTISENTSRLSKATNKYHKGLLLSKERAKAGERISETDSGSFDTDEFFEAALRHTRNQYMSK